MVDHEASCDLPHLLTSLDMIDVNFGDLQRLFVKESKSNPKMTRCRGPSIHIDARAATRRYASFGEGGTQAMSSKGNFSSRHIVIFRSICNIQEKLFIQ